MAIRSTCERNLPKEPICLIVDTCSEEQFVVEACIRIVPKAQCPQVINRNGSVGLVSELAEKLARLQIIRIDATVTEIADQQGITERAKISGGEGQAPGRVEPAMQNKALEQISAGVEDVDKAMAGPDTSSCFSASCRAKVTKSLPPMFWMPKGA